MEEYVNFQNRAFNFCRHCSAIVFISLCLISPVSTVADEPEVSKDALKLLQNYRDEIAKAKEPINKVLQSEGGKIVTQLVRGNQNDEAKIAGEQINAKLAGEAIPVTHVSVTKLFQSYDKAVATATKQIRERYLSRLDSAIKENEGKGIPTILFLADAKKEVTGGSPINHPSLNSQKAEPIIGRYVFRAGSFEEARNLLENGSVKMDDGAIYGKWAVAEDKLRVEYPNGAWVVFDLPLKKGKMKGRTHKDEEMIAEKESAQ